MGSHHSCTTPKTLPICISLDRLSWRTPMHSSWPLARRCSGTSNPGPRLCCPSMKAASDIAVWFQQACTQASKSPNRLSRTGTRVSTHRICGTRRHPGGVGTPGRTLATRTSSRRLLRRRSTTARSVCTLQCSLLRTRTALVVLVRVLAGGWAQASLWL